MSWKEDEDFQMLKAWVVRINERLEALEEDAETDALWSVVKDLQERITKLENK